jgi:hypothetical protein
MSHGDTSKDKKSEKTEQEKADEATVSEAPPKPPVEAFAVWNANNDGVEHVYVGEDREAVEEQLVRSLEKQGENAPDFRLVHIKEVANAAQVTKKRSK